MLTGDKLVATANAVEALLERKDAAELARMERAAAIADAALFEVLPLMSQGVTEEHFAVELDTAMRRGRRRGPRLPRPSWPPGRTRPSRTTTPGPAASTGATPWWSASVPSSGYRSDMTRTFCVARRAREGLARIFDVVQESQAAGAAAVRPGISAKGVDDICRQIIADAGWAERFEHGTGHGVGLDIHEAPTVSQMGTAILAPGFVVTVEPGVYVPGHGGVPSRTPLW